jgi:stage III sporulation protein AD
MKNKKIDEENERKIKRRASNMMADLIKIIAIGIIATVAALVLKPIKPEFSMFIGIASGILILLIVLNMFTPIFSSIASIVNKTGIDSNLFATLLKIVGIGYLTEFAANICDDAGNSSLAAKIMLGGKVIILVVSLPILMGIIDVITTLL